MSKPIQYRKRRKYKYTLTETATFKVNIIVWQPGRCGPFLHISQHGVLTIAEGYSWDGPSGPSVDTPSFMRAALVHDALYQMLRAEVLRQGQRKRADEILREICLEDGMSRVRAWWVYRGVRLGGAKAARPDVLTAP